MFGRAFMRAQMRAVCVAVVVVVVYVSLSTFRGALGKIGNKVELRISRRKKKT